MIDNNDVELTSEEVDQLLDMILFKTKYDFRNYHRGMIRRRILRRMKFDSVTQGSEFIQAIEENPKAMDQMVSEFCIHVTGLFRNPNLFKVFRDSTVPELSLLPYIRIWVAGCATGEEAYSLAIILEQARLLANSRIYATDILDPILSEARKGRLSATKFEQYGSHFKEFDSEDSLLHYGEMKDNHFYLQPRLMDHITFSKHNLVSDELFQEFDVIFCRNVMIYFDQDLTKKVQSQLFSSLKHKGYLILGDKESIRFSGVENKYEKVSSKEKIYRKI